MAGQACINARIEDPEPVHKEVRVQRQITADELAHLYHEIGACIWHIQYLENALHSLLTLKIDIRSPGTVTQEQAKTLLAHHQRKPLGISIKAAEKHDVLSKDLIRRLRALKEDRDWLVHRSQNEHGTAFYSDSGRKFVFGRLAQIQGAVAALKAEIVADLEQFCELAGVSPTEAEALARKQVAALKGES